MNYSGVARVDPNCQLGRVLKAETVGRPELQGWHPSWLEAVGEGAVWRQLTVHRSGIGGLGLNQPMHQDLGDVVESELLLPSYGDQEAAPGGLGADLQHDLVDRGGRLQEKGRLRGLGLGSVKTDQGVGESLCQTSAVVVWHAQPGKDAANRGAPYPVQVYFGDLRLASSQKQ